MTFQLIRHVDKLADRLTTPQRLEKLESVAESLCLKHPRAYRFSLFTYASLSTLLFILGFQVIGQLFSWSAYAFVYLASLTGLVDHAWLHTEIKNDDHNIFLTCIERSLHDPLVWIAFIAFLWLLSCVISLVLQSKVRRQPAGIVLIPAEVPELFKMVNKIAAEVGTRIDRIILTSGCQFAASAGPSNQGELNTLLVGFSGLLAVSAQELEGIVAHEAAHLKLRHPQDVTFLEQARLSWCNTMNIYRSVSPLIYLPMNLLFCWYAPILAVLIYVMRKRQELDADKIASEARDNGRYAAALLGYSLKYRRYSASLHEAIRAEIREVIPGKVSAVDKAIEDMIGADQVALAALWEESLVSRQSLIDSHPGILQRMQALGYAPSAQDESWRPDFAALLKDNSPRAVTLLGESAPGLKAKIQQIYQDPNPTSDQFDEDSMILRAQGKFAQGKTKEALDDLDNAIKQNPYSAQLYLLRASMLSQLMRSREAMADCSSAMLLRPASAEIYQIRSFVFFREKKFVQAIADLTTAIELGDNSCYTVRALAKKENGMVDEAIADLDIAIQSKPAVAPLILRAQLLIRKPDFAAALTDLNLALSLEQDNWNVFRHRAEIHHKAGNKENWLADLDSAIRLNTTSVDLFVERGMAHVNIGNEEAARADLQSALALPMDSPISRANRSWLCNHFSDWKNALNDAAALYKSGDRTLTNYVHYCRALQRTGESARALTLVDEALKRATDNPAATKAMSASLLRLRAECHFALHQYKPALKAIDAAIEANPRTAYEQFRTEIMQAMKDTL